MGLDERLPWTSLVGPIKNKCSHKRRQNETGLQKRSVKAIQPESQLNTVFMNSSRFMYVGGVH